MYEPLLHIKRDGIAEMTIFGSIAIFEEGVAVPLAGGDPLLYGRSLTKAYQIKPIARDLRDLPLKARALSLASHSAEDFHLLALKDIVTTGRLQLPESAPMLRPLEGKSQANHPCSGKHSAILRASEKHGWPLENYLSEDHPYHAAYLSSLRAVLGEKWRPEKIAPDGCGLPAPTFYLSELAQLYSALAQHRDDDWIWSAMTDHPEMIGGTGRLDTSIMQMNPGRVVAKEGADGLLGLAILLDQASPGVVGLVIKVAHGHDPKALGAIAHTLLKRYNIEVPAPMAPYGQTLEVVYK